MKIVWMNGGLGNQAFQYIFLRYLEIATGDDCYIDDRFFFQEKVHNGYELDKVFGVKPKKLSEFFDADVWEYMVEVTKQDVSIVEILREAGLSIDFVSEGDAYIQQYSGLKNLYTDKYYSFAGNSYEPKIVNLPGNCYYHGYYINVEWFSAIINCILEEFKFPEITDNANEKTLKEIQNSESVGIHVRRGDFVNFGWALDLEWYRNSVKHIRSYASSPVFFLFSDEMGWCRERLAEIGFLPKDKIVFVENNKAENSFRDLQLMSYCKKMIIANSSFSYLAALLNRNPDKIVLNPTLRGIV